MHTVKLRFQKAPILPNAEAWHGRAHLIVDWHSVDDYDGAILVSPECMTSQEIEAAADEIIRDLQAIKTKARTLEWAGLQGADRPKVS